MNKFISTKAKFVNSFSALAHRNYRCFWIGQLLSLMGTRTQQTAQQWLVYDMTRSPLLLGLLGVFQFGPVLLFSLFAGVLVDRFPKKKILLLTQSILMLQAFILGILVVTGYIQYWHILVLASVMGFANTLDMPTRQSYIFELVGKEDLMSGIALNSAIVNLAKVLGPAIGGLIITFLGTGACFLLNGISFIAVLIGLYLINTNSGIIRKKNARVLADVLEGLRYIADRRILWTAVLAMLAVGTFAMNSDVIIPVFAREVLRKQASGYSLLLSAMGLGSLIGAFFVSSRSRKGPSRKILFGSAAGVCLFYVAMGAVHNYLLSLIMLAAAGFFTITFLTMVNSTIQLNSEDAYRGRAMSVYSLVLGGTTPIGNLFAGSVTEKLGANAGFFACGATALIFIVIILVVIKRKNELVATQSLFPNQ